MQMAKDPRNGVVVDVEKAVALLRAPGEFMSLNISARLALVDTLKCNDFNPSEILKSMCKKNIHKLNIRVRDDLMERTKAFCVDPRMIKNEHVEKLMPKYNAKIRLDEIISILSNVQIGNKKLLSDFSVTLTNYNALKELPSSTLLEKVSKEFAAVDAEMQMSFLNRYVDYAIILTSTLGPNTAKQTKDRLLHAINLRDSTEL